MVTLTSIPSSMDKALYFKSLAKEYKTPLDMVYYLSRDLNDEQTFFAMLEWNKANNRTKKGKQGYELQLWIYLVHLELR